MIEDHGALEAWWRGGNFLINDGVKCRISFVRTTLMDCKKKSKWNITKVHSFEWNHYFLLLIKVGKSSDSKGQKNKDIEVR